MLFLRNNLTVVEPVWVTGFAEGPSVLALLDPPVWDHFQRNSKSGMYTHFTGSCRLVCSKSWVPPPPSALHFRFHRTDHALFRFGRVMYVSCHVVVNMRLPVCPVVPTRPLAPTVSNRQVLRVGGGLAVSAPGAYDRHRGAQCRGGSPRVQAGAPAGKAVPGPGQHRQTERACESLGAWGGWGGCVCCGVGQALITYAFSWESLGKRSLIRGLCGLPPNRSWRVAPLVLNQQATLRGPHPLSRSPR
jgi:hypothetical protein